MTIDRLRAVLNAIGPPVTTTQLAEMLWLAAHLPADGQQAGTAPEPAGAVDAETADNTGSGAAVSGEAQPPMAGPGALQEKRQPLHRPSAPGEGAGGAAEALLVPTAPMLRHPRAIQRALRPLKRRIPSRRHRVLDEAATAARVADRPQERPWAPVMVAARERWLSLALVVDVGSAMSVWQPLIGELREAMFRLGAFRDVRVLAACLPGRQGRCPQFSQRPGDGSCRSVDPTGRQAVLLFSDCSGPHWWEGRVDPLCISGPDTARRRSCNRWPNDYGVGPPLLRCLGWPTLARPGAPNTALRFTSTVVRSDSVQGRLPCRSWSFPRTGWPTGPN